MKQLGWLLLIFIPLGIQGQTTQSTLRLFPPIAYSNLGASLKLSSQLSQYIDIGTNETNWDLDQWRQSYPVMPGYARENPAGHAYLCRLELKAENTLPIGIWVKIADPKELQPTQIPHTYLRMKLLRF